MGLLKSETFVCIDCETTGLDPKQDRVIEVAVVLFTFQELISQYESLIDPCCPIPELSISIHHITQEMVQGQPKARDVLPQVLELIGSHIVVGHGVKFDLDVIAAEAERCGVPHRLENQRYYDTLRLARLYGESPENSLKKLAAHFNVELGGAHRAMNDVLANIEVFKRLCEKFQTTKQIFEVLSKPIRMKVMPLGKHKGRLLKDVPDQYLQWMANKDFDDDLLFSIRSELSRRKKGNLFSQSTNPFKDFD